MNSDLTKLFINTIRTLSIDAIQKANSGHPGAPMGLAPVAFTIWDKFMRHNPSNPDWANRDRFILSAGHASMLLYSTLHLMGYEISLDDIKSFRQLHGKCAGHPEFGLAPGVETTTGPLGQGAATSVGFAIAQKWLAEYFNKPGFNIVDYKIYSVLGDGCIMEGITHEAASIAGHLGLNNLTWIYDDNKITIEGNTDLAFSEDVAERFASYNWYVQRVRDANDLFQIEKALSYAVDESSRPSLIIINSHIAYGSPNMQDTSEAHGSPLGEEEIKLTKKNYGWDPEKKFFLPAEIIPFQNKTIAKGTKLESDWTAIFEQYKKKYPDLAKDFELMQANELPDGWDENLTEFPADNKGIASRNASGKILNSIAAKVPWLIGGSADLAPSTKTFLDGFESFSNGNYKGRNLHFGIREHAMGSIASGLSLSKLRCYAATFLVFSDYMRMSIRLSAMMHQPIIYIFTHDSIGLGEDGPTHQPIEHLASLRAIPNLDVIRPADANELVILWKYIMKLKDKPVALILSRQNIPTFDRKKYASADGALKGAYILVENSDNPDVILMGTGSEVQYCLEAFESLDKSEIKTRVVSIPCWSLFNSQDSEYREKILPPNLTARIAIEAGVTFGWAQYTGDQGKIIGIDTYGASAPYQDLYREFGLTVENIVKEAKSLIAGK